MVGENISASEKESENKTKNVMQEKNNSA